MTTSNVTNESISYMYMYIDYTAYFPDVYRLTTYGYNSPNGR